MGTEMNGRDMGGSDNSLSILFCIILTDESMLKTKLIKWEQEEKNTKAESKLR